MSRSFGLVLLGLTSITQLGCQTAPPVVPRSGPKSALPPVALLPREHDFVLRFDVARLRTVIGPEGVLALAKSTLPPDHAALASILSGKANVVWAGVSLVEGGSSAVIVARGDGAALDPTAWMAADRKPFAVRDNGDAGVRWFDRTAEASAKDPERLLWLEGGTLASVSRSQIAPVERELGATSDSGRLAPKEDALIAFAARKPALAAGLGVKDKRMAEAMSYATSLEGLVDVVGEELQMELLFGFSRSDVARDVTEGVQRLLAQLRAGRNQAAATIAANAGAARVGGTKVRVRFVLPREKLKAILLSSATLPQGG